MKEKAEAPREPPGRGRGPCEQLGRLGLMSALPVARARKYRAAPGGIAGLVVVQKIPFA